MSPNKLSNILFKALLCYAIFTSSILLVYTIRHINYTKRVAPKKDPIAHLHVPYWELRNSVYSFLRTKGKLVFVGNSITEYGSWNELFYTDRIVNRGIAGDISSGILKRIDGYLSDTPSCIVLMDGINDIGEGIALDTIIKNYVATINKCKTANVPIVVQSTLFVNDNDVYQIKTDTINALVLKLNTFLSGYCSRQAVPYLDVNEALSFNGRLRSEYTLDGIHLTGQAYVKWKEFL